MSSTSVTADEIEVTCLSILQPKNRPWFGKFNDEQYHRLDKITVLTGSLEKIEFSFIYHNQGWGESKVIISLSFFILFPIAYGVFLC